MEDNNCILHLEHLLFDHIEFKREGFHSDQALDVSFGFGFELDDPAKMVVHACVRVKKQEEYELEVAASGYFQYSGSQEMKESMAKQNAVAILFPYIRSQITLLTAQPEMEALVLPPVNIASILEHAENRTEK